MKIFTADALVIGAGLAGLRVALACHEAGQTPLLLSLVSPKRSQSVCAQAGMQASLGHGVLSAGDDEYQHFVDTVQGSDWGCDQTVAQMFTHVAPKAVRQLAQWGVPWTRLKAGPKTVVRGGVRTRVQEPAYMHGLIAGRAIGGTSKPRVCFCADGSGHAMLYALDNQAIAAGIEVHERVEALRLIYDETQVYGVIARCLVSGELRCYLANTVTLASGGYGQLWQDSSNSVITQGMGAALALATERVPLGNPEAVQFHPTAIVPGAILVSEACRGEGGVLRDVNGHRFMLDYQPELQELASRDVVARCMQQHLAAGFGVPSPHGPHLWLDITALGAEHIHNHLGEVATICQQFLGIDPSREWIPVRPAQHYSMGGIRTHADGQAYGLKRLYAVGEAACWDLHGFNRLGGNSLAETVVAGMIVGDAVARASATGTLNMAYVQPLAQAAYDDVAQQIAHLLGRSQGDNPWQLYQQLQQLMSQHVGIVRTSAGLAQARSTLQYMLERSQQMALQFRVRHANPELELALRLPKMIQLALVITQAAAARTESRGAHYRLDFPKRNDRDWLQRSLGYWQDEQPQLAYEPLLPRTMAYPPTADSHHQGVIAHPESGHQQQQMMHRLTAHATAESGHQQPCLGPMELPESLRQPNARVTLTPVQPERPE